MLTCNLYVEMVTGHCDNFSCSYLLCSDTSVESLHFTGGLCVTVRQEMCYCTKII